MELKVINDQGQEAAKPRLPTCCSVANSTRLLVHQVVTAYQANARAGNRQQKDRSEVRHTTTTPSRGAKGYRSCPCARERQIWARRRSHLPELPGREISARRSTRRCSGPAWRHPLRVEPPGRLVVIVDACPSMRPRPSSSPKDQEHGARSESAGDHRRSDRKPPCRPATCPTSWFSRLRKRPTQVSWSASPKVLVTKDAVAKFEEMGMSANLNQNACCRCWFRRFPKRPLLSPTRTSKDFPCGNRCYQAGNQGCRRVVVQGPGRIGPGRQRQGQGQALQRVHRPPQGWKKAFVSLCRARKSISSKGNRNGSRQSQAHIPGSPRRRPGRQSRPAQGQTLRWPDRVPVQERGSQPQRPSPFAITRAVVSKQAYRMVDFKRNKDGIPGKVERLEYDPNRTANIALVCYADAPLHHRQQGMVVGQQVISRIRSADQARQRPPIRNIPVGTTICCVEMLPGRVPRSHVRAGTSGPAPGSRRYVRPNPHALRQETRRFIVDAAPPSVRSATKRTTCARSARLVPSVGAASVPTVRGVAMNPIDHPHGGGEGRTGDRVPVNLGASPPRATVPATTSARTHDRSAPS